MTVAEHPGDTPLARAVAAFGLAWRAGPWVLLAHVAITLATGALPVVVAWLTKLVIDGLVGGAAWGMLLGLACGLAVTGAVAGAAPHLDRYLSAELVRRIGLASMDRLYEAVGRFVGLRRFEDPDFHDRLRLARDSGGNASSDLVHSAVGVCQGLVTGVGFVVSLFVLSPALTAAVLLTAIPAALLQRRLAGRRARMFWAISPAMRREIFYSQLLGEVRAAKEVRLFGLNMFFRRRMLAERRAADAGQRRMDRHEMLAQSGLALLLSAVAGAGLVWAIFAARRGTLSVGDVSMLVAAVASAQGAVSQVVSDYGLARQSLLMLEHFFSVLAAGPDLPAARAALPTPPLRRGIELRDVWFRYSPDHPWVLRGIDLTIRYGDAVALVGANGAGKSTIVKLLCRFYDPTRGSITWDGVDLREVDTAELRARIGAVFQDYMEYDLTAADNIGIGELAAFDDRAKLESCARLAGVHDTIAGLPHGYDTLLSRLFHPDPAPRDQETEAGAETETDAEADAEAGVMLSTGQWQRLALARAMLRDRPDLLILDEPSSGLDAEAEHQVHTMLRKRRAGRTSLLISHRLGAVRDAHQIVVLKDGRIAEQGAHAELMELRGYYARLFTLQSSGYREGYRTTPGVVKEAQG